MGAGHHIFGPSSLERRMLCPGSYRMEMPFWLKPEEKGEDSEEGKLLHAAVIHGRMDNLNAEQQIVLEAFLETLKDYKNPQFEVELFADDGYGNTLISGTCDILGIAISDNILTVQENKAGRIKVEEAPDNIQGAGYALMAHDFLGAGKVRTRIKQPRSPGGDTSHIFTDFESIRAHIRNIISKCKESGALCIPGDKQCRYCKAKDTCPARLNYAQEIMVQAEALPPVAEWNDAHLGEWYNRFCQLTKFAAVVKNELKNRCEKAGACAGWGMKGSGSTREIPDILSAYKLARTNDISESEFLEVCTVSAPQLEAALAAKAVEKATAASVKLSKKDAKADAAALIAGVCTFKEKAAQLERLSA